MSPPCRSAFQSVNSLINATKLPVCEGLFSEAETPLRAQRGGGTRFEQVMKRPDDSAAYVGYTMMLTSGSFVANRLKGLQGIYSGCLLRIE